MRNLNWYKDEFLRSLVNYDVSINHFKEGDFGDLDRIEFNSPNQGGEISVWSSGWLGVNLVCYKSGKEILNVLCSADELEKQNAVLEELRKLI